MYILYEYFFLKESSKVIDKPDTDTTDKTQVPERTKHKSKKYPLSFLKIKREKEEEIFSVTIKEPKFKCDVCGKMWKTKGELNAHKITHSDARPYICEICGQVCD